MILRATIFALAVSPSLFGQSNLETTPVVPENSLITITPKPNKEIEGSLPNDEGTNDPTVTGSTAYIQGDKRYYIKSNEQITIIYHETTPQ
jgi:hypothetical protein